LYNPSEIYAYSSSVQDWVPRSDALIILDEAHVAE
jgi:hypothetical protein